MPYSRAVVTVTVLLFADVSAWAPPARSGCSEPRITHPVLKADGQVSIKITHGSLPDILKDLATRCGARFLADDVPVRTTVDIEFTGPLSKLLDKLGDDFDYSWRMSGAGVILFNKRFKNPVEQPQLIPAELRQAAKDVLTVLPEGEADLEHVRWGNVLIELSRTFTADQTVRLRSGGTLAYSELSPGQRALLDKTIYLSGYGLARGYWERLFFVLDNVQHSEIAAVDPTSAQPAAGTAKRLYMYHLIKDKRGQAAGTPIGPFTRENKP